MCVHTYTSSGVPSIPHEGHASSSYDRTSAPGALSAPETCKHSTTHVWLSLGRRHKVTAAGGIDDAEEMTGGGHQSNNGLVGNAHLDRLCYVQRG